MDGNGQVPLETRCRDERILAVLVAGGLVVLTATVLIMGWQLGTDSVSPAPSRDLGFVLDLNVATWAELAALPGLGEQRARDVVARRESIGPWHSVEELLEIKGIGPATIERLADHVKVASPHRDVASRPVDRR